MIDVKKLIKPPKDIDTMVTRKVNDGDFRVVGVVVNKKSNKAYNIDMQMNTEQLTIDSKVKVCCSCEDFKFRWAFVLDKEGALLNPRNFQLTPPVVTNPDEVMNACKHVHAFIERELAHKLKAFSKRKDAL